MFYILPPSTYLTTQEQICDKCGLLIKDKFVFNCQWNRKSKPLFNYFCLKCFKSPRLSSDIDGLLLFNIVSKIPTKAQVWIPTPPQISTSRLNDIYKTEGEIIDKTRYAGREHYNSLDIVERRRLTQERIKELDSPAAPSFFNKLQDSKLIEKSETKKLQNEITN